jgi:hypothetical protein
VLAATHEQLTSGPEWTGRDWGPRRQLVWLADGFAQFKDFFPDAEAILFQLALHECEPDIANNATKTWQRLFSLQLSGTPVPFEDRLRLLETRFSRAHNIGGLFAGALRTIFNFNGVRTLGAPTIAGRIPEPDWYPADRASYRSALRRGLSVLVGATVNQPPILAHGAKEALVTNVELLTRLGWLDDVRDVVDIPQLDEDTRARLVSDLKYFLVRRRAPDDSEVPEQYLEKVGSWIAELEPGTLHGRLVEQVGGNSWNHYGSEREWETALTVIAKELLSSRKSFNLELPWLLSSEAKSAFELGHALGSEDREGVYLDTILDSSGAKQAGLARGYVSGLLYRAKFDAARVAQRLDVLEERDPLLAFQVAIAAGTAVHVFDRAVRLINDQKIPPYNLRNFTFWVGDRHITNAEVLTAIAMLLPFAKAGDQHCCDVILDFLGARVHAGKLWELLSLNDGIVWDALAAVTAAPGGEAFWWANVLVKAAPTSPQLAIRLACQGLVSDNFQFSDQAKSVISQFAVSYPEQVMEEVGNLMLASETSQLFFIRKFPVFTALPTAVVTSWIARHGVEAAQRIARHLPRPFLDNGSPSLHPLTEYVLREFENDDRTFNEFCAGVHSFQMYAGDIAATKEREADMAKLFLAHPLRRVRDWAQLEIQEGLHHARLHREHMDEMGL